MHLRGTMNSVEHFTLIALHERPHHCGKKGKSTLFNALTETQGAEAANYPFCTIEPNSGIVSVPDPRLEVLSKINSSVKTVPATLEFVDVAGLIKGASAGEGLGNAFLATIRQCDAIVHVSLGRAKSNEE